MIRCLVVDDHAALREGIKSVLDRADDMEVVCECADGEGAIREADICLPDVVLMDVRMPGIDGFEATRRILANHPDQRIILYTGHDERGMVAEGLACGAHGYVLKDAPTEDILRAVRIVATGGSYLDPSLAGSLFSRKDKPKLSPREAEMLSLLAEGLTYPEISGRLYISPETVRTHVRNAITKLDASTRTHAVALALGYGLIGKEHDGTED